jgi:thiamine-monophosphate kinase
VNEGARVGDIGEFALISALQESLPDHIRSSDAVPLGIGDDAAAWRPSPGKTSVITTDTLVEGIHFRLVWTDWRSLGHKMLAANLSDIASMGATPVLATITLGLRGDERVDDLLELYKGVVDLAAPHRVVIAGGDIVRTEGPLVLSVTAIGEGGQLLRRDGARPGDRIVVSGTLGASAAGLALLANPELRKGATTAELLVGAHLRPNPRIALGKLLAANGVRCAMDLSDGLLGDLPKILAAGGVSARVDARDIPVLPAVRALFPNDWLGLAVRGGEDYELLATMPDELFPSLRAAAVEIGATLTDIGQVMPLPNGESAQLLMVDTDGAERVINAGAFDHFGQGISG